MSAAHGVVVRGDAGMGRQLVEYARYGVLSGGGRHLKWVSGWSRTRNRIPVKRWGRRRREGLETLDGRRANTEKQWRAVKACQKRRGSSGC